MSEHPNQHKSEEAAVDSKQLVGKGAEELNKHHVNIERPEIVNREFNFTFRKFKNELGEEVKRPSFKLNLPVLTADGLVAELGKAKVMDFILDLVADAIKQAAKDQVDDSENPVNEQESLDLRKLTIEYLASQPKAERTGGGISKETWEAWASDYVEVMMGTMEGAKEDQVKNAATLFVKRYAPVKSHKPVIQKLRERLALYTANTKNLEEFAEVVEFLDKKAETLLNTDFSTNLLENI